MCADLADNRPGESARRKADELKAAAPGRAILARLLNVRTDEHDWRKGAKGEEEVAKRLVPLGEDWHVLHAIPVNESGTDIDHLVIGPPGVFALNTKNHLNANVWIAENVFMVNGQKQTYLRNSRSERARVTRTLTNACGFDVNAEAVIVVMAKTLTIKGLPKDVYVVPRKKIRTWLQNQPVKLMPDQISSIYEAARNGSIWLGGGNGSGSVIA